MHWIERHILKRLAFADELRYIQLLPDGVEGNLFQYHARQLEKQGLIGRSKDGYQLTEAGRRFVADLSQTRQMNPRKFPRPMVMIAAQRDDERLMFRWRRQPYRGQVSLPFGRWTSGQPAADMAAEQLLYKAGFSAELSYVGSVSLITTSEHLLFAVFEADRLRPESLPDGLTGQFFWAADPGPDLITGQREILDWLQNLQRPAFAEFDLRD